MDKDKEIKLLEKEIKKLKFERKYNYDILGGYIIGVIATLFGLYIFGVCI